MSTFADHYLTVTDPRGQQLRGQIVYFKASQAHPQPPSAVVHIVTSDWLAFYGYEAIYQTPRRSIRGYFTVHGYTHVAGEWLVMGTFQATLRDTIVH